MQYTLIFCLPIIVISLSIAHSQNAEANESLRKLTCTAIREEPGAPTYGFQLKRQKDDTFTAKFLDYPGDPSLPPTTVASISGLACRFQSETPYFFQCQRVGGSIESIEILERKLSLISDDYVDRKFKEFRATGIAIPDGYFVSRFGPADRCEIQQ